VAPPVVEASMMAVLHEGPEDEFDEADAYEMAAEAPPAMNAANPASLSQPGFPFQMVSSDPKRYNMIACKPFCFL